MYCHTCAEKSFENMTIQKIKTWRSLKKTTQKHRNGDKKLRKNQKLNLSKKECSSTTKMTEESFALREKKAKTVKRSKVRVKSAKGVRNMNVVNVRRREEKKKTKRNLILNVN